MTKLPVHKKPARKRLRNLFIVLVILLLIVGMPFLLLNYQAHKSGMSISQVIQRRMIKSDGNAMSSEWRLANEIVTVPCVALNATMHSSVIV